MPKILHSGWQSARQQGGTTALYSPSYSYTLRTGFWFRIAFVLTSSHRAATSRKPSIPRKSASHTKPNISIRSDGMGKLSLFFFGKKHQLVQPLCIPLKNPYHQLQVGSRPRRVYAKHLVTVATLWDDWQALGVHLKVTTWGSLLLRCTWCWSKRED